MTSLKRLGIQKKWHAEDEDVLEYYTLKSTDEFKNPRQVRKYFERLVKSIARNSSKIEGIKRVKIQFTAEDKLEYYHREFLLGKFKETTCNLQYKYKDISNKDTLPHQILTYGGCIAAGITGLALSYNFLAEWVTNAEVFNNPPSYLLTPAIGLFQAAIPVLGSLLAAGVSGATGTFVGYLISEPYNDERQKNARNKERQLRTLEHVLEKE